MTKRTNSGRIFFLTITALALWQQEIVGQLSDGVWENATPKRHWEPWVQLEPVLKMDGRPHVESGSYFARSTYNLDRLLDFGKDDPDRFVVRDRMINIGRMALALISLGLRMSEHPAIAAACDMPATREEFDAKQATLDWETGSTRRNMAHVNADIATAYYGVQRYGLPQLKADLKSIRAAMACIEFK